MSQSIRRPSPRSTFSRRAAAAHAPPLARPASARRAVAFYMTPSPHSVGVGQPLETAHEIMLAHGIRHLPVLDGGKLAGLLSQRDLYFVESIDGVDPAEVRVEEAMSQYTYSVRPDTPIEEVAGDMAERKYGCAVVMDGEKVVGLFTTTDALRALAGAARGGDSDA